MVMEEINGLNMMKERMKMELLLILVGVKVQIYIVLHIIHQLKID